jgi:hypothetical protein
VFLFYRLLLLLHAPAGFELQRFLTDREIENSIRTGWAEDMLYCRLEAADATARSLIVGIEYSSLLVSDIAAKS